MSVIRLRYEGGKAAAFFHILAQQFVVVGPDNNKELQTHPAYIRQSYQSLSGLSGEVLMANSDLIAQALTYRPQYGEFLVPAQYTLAQVDRNELATAYPIIFGLEIIGDLLTVTTSDCHLPIIKGIALEKDAIEVRSQDVKYGLPTIRSPGGTLGIA